MEKLLRFNYRKTLDRGFSTVEILISIITALAFVTFSLQSFVLGVAMKVQAQEKQRANQLIQEDLERLSELASIIAEDHDNKCNPAAYANGYARELWDDIAAIAAPTAKLLKESDGTEKKGTTLTLARDHVSNASNVTPFRTLKINYRVTNSDNDDVVERYVEVIPDVALRCP